jgi:hypothetical protein
MNSSGDGVNFLSVRTKERPVRIPSMASNNKNDLKGRIYYSGISSFSLS